jgi:hypothetical protein
MANILAALFRLRQFVFEYGPFFLVSWLGLAITTALMAVSQRKGTDLNVRGSFLLKYRPLAWLWQLLSLLLWRPAGKTKAHSAFRGRLFFSLALPIPALVVTALIGWEAVLLRLGLTVLLALPLSRFVTSEIPGRDRNFREQTPKAAGASPSPVLDDGTAALPAYRPAAPVRVFWKSFTGQIDGAVVPLLVAFSLASALLIFVPTYSVRPWLREGSWWGPYLASLLAILSQLSGGTEVIIASALLVKGASLGTALSVMLVAPISTIATLRHFQLAGKGKAMTLYLAAAWFVAASLGVAANSIQRFFTVY